MTNSQTVNNLTKTNQRYDREPQPSPLQPNNIRGGSGSSDRQNSNTALGSASFWTKIANFTKQVGSRSGSNNSSNNR